MTSAEKVKIIYQNNQTWPFILARKILHKIKYQTPQKGFVLFETGYGPSGLPHIGTFGEVVRTLFVKHAFECLAPEIKTKLICVSDDIDGLRKIPNNIPNRDLIEPFIKNPLTSVPDPFKTCKSYGDYMNNKLKSFLDFFEFQYEFLSATENYKSGKFNGTMQMVATKYDEIMNLMLPTLGTERQKTYSPFMPIDKESGIVIEQGVSDVNEQNGIVKYQIKDNKKEISIKDGNCKLQWKVDFGARWADFEVDFEIYGKDHLANEKIYKRICSILGGKPPVTFCYEMFLSEDGAKISKSNGNGIAVEDWLKYAPKESLVLYMFQKPQTAKRLYFDVIPKAMDEYLSFLNSYYKPETTLEEKTTNPVFHIHFGQVPPQPNFSITYSLLLNLASACNPEHEDILWDFIHKYQNDLNKNNSPLLANMAKCALNYYNDFIKPHKEYYAANEAEKKAILDLKTALLNKEMLEAKDLQNIVFNIGKKHGYEKKTMKNWFSLLYQTLLGQKQGPRMGSFIKIYGVKNFISLINKIISRNISIT